MNGTVERQEQTDAFFNNVQVDDRKYSSVHGKSLNGLI